MALPMTEGEILREYRQAKDPKGQIKVLSELCSVSQEEIIDILARNGIDRRTLPRKRKSPDKDTASQSPSRKSKSPDSVDIVGYVQSLKERRRELQSEIDKIDETLRNIVSLIQEGA